MEAGRSIQVNVDERGRNKKIVQMALVKPARAIADGKVRMQIGDLDRLIRLQAFLDRYVEDRPQPRSADQVAEYIQGLFHQLSSFELNQLSEAVKSRTRNLKKPAE